ncbi:MAG: hypothetical protein PHG97_02765 [Candidatus Margulisbacteria bacterium]|nr:hypothetical protein [Candidatus Margulisiibacteriota bacterium]
MNNKLRQILIAVILLATAGYALFTYWPRSKQAAPAAPVATATVAAASTAEAAPKMNLFEMPAPTAEVTLVDPFALRIAVIRKEEEPQPAPTLPTAEKPKPPVEPKLQGIWLDSGMRVAFISDQYVQVGGKILGWKVVAINKDWVVLQKGSTEKILRLEEK